MTDAMTVWVAGTAVAGIVGAAGANWQCWDLRRRTKKLEEQNSGIFQAKVTTKLDRVETDLKDVLATLKDLPDELDRRYVRADWAEQRIARTDEKIEQLEERIGKVEGRRK